MDKSGTKLENRLRRNRLQYEYIAELAQLGLALLHPAWLGSILVCSRPYPEK